ncbi:hypothetical protein XA68_15558 [Ophiocordyceps unilateralis]|uniref:Histone-lysine N-methyltransferase n=1 Tax=Ophiocordyceps unilateralis TaxID=268505 RepID=A0A2A9P860_OPHUN|nr:hypothetical protein XA68_15558 [Ophiocordyceps unilateralis]
MSSALLADSGFSAPATDASSSSTPPTTVADSASLLSEAASSDKLDVITVAADPVRRRSGRVSAVSPVYNLSRLSGTDCHGRRRANGHDVSDRRRSLVTYTVDPPSATTPRTRRQARLCLDSPLAPTSPAPTALAARLSALGKRGRDTTSNTSPGLPRELRRLQDTNEFAGIDDRPVIHTVWSNGKFVDPNQPPVQVRKRLQTPTAIEPNAKDDDDAAEPITNTRKRRVKNYLDKGLYAGQVAPLDVTKGLTPAEKKKLAQMPELRPSGRVSTVMPLPIYNGLRALIAGRDFKLPYNICNPLPPGQPKPDEWKKMTKNRFIGHAKEYWRKMPHLHDYQSKCVCEPEDGCGESCQNRIMLYECDATNCNVGKDFCTNRAFADLMARRAKGGKYRVGVEVIKTVDRGYGVRSNRSFRPNQIIMEYTGEIITEEECERRMNDIYKDNECYYLMSFDQNMIIDATTGSIARFVNHSCKPNCRMIKWIVSGQPRVALFAGDKPIVTGDELTYDYNFDPFSAKNVQTCLCGEANCRGVLGPKPREVKPPKTDLKSAVVKAAGSKVKPTIKATAKAASKVAAVKPAVQAAIKAGKRKLKELLGDEGASAAEKNATKRRKCQPATRTKTSSGTGLDKAKPLKKGRSAILTSKKSAASLSLARTSKKPSVTVGSKKTGSMLAATKATKKVISTLPATVPKLKAATVPAKRRVVLKKKKKHGAIKTYEESVCAEKPSPRASSPTTIVAKAGDADVQPDSKPSPEEGGQEEQVPTPCVAETKIEAEALIGAE